MFSLKTLLKGTFSLLTCHLQFSITARVSMTLKHQLSVFFFAEKTMFSFQMLVKGTFSLLTCHLQFRITARVSLTLKRQSDYKTASTFWVSQESTNSQTNGLEQNKWSSPLVWSRGWVRLGREAKNTTKKYNINWRRKNKRKKTRKKKQWQFLSLRAVEKLVLPNPFLLINNKAPKVFKVQVEYIP